ATSPLMNVQVSPRRASEADLRILLERMLDDQHIDSSTITTRRIEVDGAPAAELLGNGTNGGVPTKFFAVILSDEVGVIIEPGRFPADHSESLPRFRDIARSTHRLPGVVGPVRSP